MTCDMRQLSFDAKETPWAVSLTNPPSVGPGLNTKHLSVDHLFSHLCSCVDPLTCLADATAERGSGWGTPGELGYLSTCLRPGPNPLGPGAAVIFLKMACPSASQNALPLGDIISLETVDRHRQRHRKSNISILILRRLALQHSALPPDS